MRKMKKTEIRNLKCPFCGATIKGKIPEGLNLKKIIKLINKIKVAEEKKHIPPDDDDWEDKEEEEQIEKELEEMEENDQFD